MYICSVAGSCVMSNISSCEMKTGGDRKILYQLKSLEGEGRSLVRSYSLLKKNG